MASAAAMRVSRYLIDTKNWSTGGIDRALNGEETSEPIHEPPPHLAGRLARQVESLLSRIDRGKAIRTSDVTAIRKAVDEYRDGQEGGVSGE